MVTSAQRSPSQSEGAHRGSSQPAVRGGGGGERSEGRGEEGHLQHPHGPPQQCLRARRCERQHGSNRLPLKRPPVTQMGKNTRRNHPWKPFFSVPRGRAGKTLTKGACATSSCAKGRGCSAGSVLCPLNRCRAGRGSPPLAEPPKFTQPRITCNTGHRDPPGQHLQVIHRVTHHFHLGMPGETYTDVLKQQKEGESQFYQNKSLNNTPRF